MLQSFYFVEIGIYKEGEDGGQIEEDDGNAEGDVLQADHEAVDGCRIPKDAEEHQEEVQITAGVTFSVLDIEGIEAGLSLLFAGLCIILCFGVFDEQSVENE